MKLEADQPARRAVTGGLPPAAETPSPLRVSLLDGSELVTTGFASMLRPHGHRVRVVRQPSPAGALVACDLLLVDFALMPPALVEGLLVRARVAERVVSYSWSSRPPSGPWWSVAQGRVAAHLTKALPAEQLVERLEAASRRAPGEPRPGAAELSGALATSSRAAGLTPREQDIVSRIARGMSNAEIAEQLYLSINSVKTYVRTAYRKMGVTTRSQAVAWWYAGDSTSDLRSAAGATS